MQKNRLLSSRENIPMLLCFGDSNTYGYDPRGFLGDRYPEEHRWVDILSRKTAWTILNAGENGREIPRTVLQYQQAERLIAQTSPSLFAVMLGTNDLLRGAAAQDAAFRMEEFLRHLHPSCSPVLLIAPPPMRFGTWVTEPSLIAESRKLAEHYQHLAHRLHVFFADAGQWNVSLAFDGVHFTETGHRSFAEGLWQYLPRQLDGDTLTSIMVGKNVTNAFDQIAKETIDNH